MVVIIGACARPLWLHLSPCATIQDCLAILHQQNVIPDPSDCLHTIYCSRKLPPLARTATLGQSGLSELSVLQYRYRLLGGSASSDSRLRSKQRGYRTELRRSKAAVASSSGHDLTVTNFSLPESTASDPPDVPPADPHMPSTPSHSDISLLSALSYESSCSRLLSDIQHQQMCVLGRAARASSEDHLVFVHDPASSTPYTRLEEPSDSSPASGRGPYALRRGGVNASHLAYEDFLVSTLGYVRSLGHDHPQRLLTVIQQLERACEKELERLATIRETQWEIQRMRKSGVAADGTSSVAVDTVRYFRRSFPTWEVLRLSHYLVATVMHLHFGLTRRAANVLIAGLKSISRMTARAGLVPQDSIARIDNTVNDIPSDVRTMVAHLDIDPVTHAQVMCPSCFAIHRVHPIPPTCTFQRTPMGPVCGAKLWRTRTIQDRTYMAAGRTLLRQDMPAWFGRMLSRPGVEDVIDTAHIRTANPGPCNGLRDIWDGTVLQKIPDPVVEGAIFINPPAGDGHGAPEGRYVVGLAIDGFNPHGNLEAKQSVTVTAIYMTLLNLPPHERFLPENLFLVCIIPGPDKPSLDEINHILSLLVDDLELFYEHGVYFVRTAKYAQGRLVRVALGPLVCDLLAARQAAGFGQPNSRFFCTCCWQQLGDIEDLNYAQWAARDGEQHKQDALKWRDAQSEQERRKLFADRGVRWSELCRLRYWDPILFTVIDSMHNLYLGLLQDHCREIWGMNVEVQDGDGRQAPERVTFPRPEPIDLQAAWYYLKNDGEQFAKCSEAALWHMCLELDLRRPKPHRAALISVLQEWRSVVTNELPEDVLEFIQDFDPATYTIPSHDILLAEAALAKGDDIDKLARRAKPVLIEMCEARGLNASGTRADMACLLVEWRSRANDTSGGRVPDGPARLYDPPKLLRPVKSKGPAAVLGRTTIKEFQADMDKTVLPSWVNPAPKASGSKQHGKLSADQWRTLCTIHLPITLIRLWGTQETDSRERQMLNNFMHLVTAVEIAGMLSITPAHVDAYKQALDNYLRTLKDLFKEAKFKPNHHLAVHVGDTFLAKFGPLHPIRAFHTERNNFMLQQENTNMKFGEMELTYLTYTCRAANLKWFLRDEQVSSSVSEMIDAYEALAGEDRRGTRLRDSEFFSRRKEPVKTQSAPLQDDYYRMLTATLNEVSGSVVYMAQIDGVTGSAEGGIPLSNQATYLSSLQLQGVTFKSFKQSPRDSCISFRQAGTLKEGAGHIIAIFEHTRCTLQPPASITETFLVVKPFESLSVGDIRHDHYRQYQWAGGLLYYDTSLPPTIIRPRDVICHAAKTTLKIVNIHRPCVHILPLNRLLDLTENEEHGHGVVV